jgi:hypothetical protein
VGSCSPHTHLLLLVVARLLLQHHELLLLLLLLLQGLQRSPLLQACKWACHIIARLRLLLLLG